MYAVVVNIDNVVESIDIFDDREREVAERCFLQRINEYAPGVIADAVHGQSLLEDREYRCYMEDDKEICINFVIPSHIGKHIW